MDIKQLQEQLNKYKNLKYFVDSRSLKLRDIDEHIQDTQHILERSIKPTTGNVRITREDVDKIIDNLNKLEIKLGAYFEWERIVGLNNILKDILDSLGNTPIDNLQIKLREVE